MQVKKLFEFYYNDYWKRSQLDKEEIECLKMKMCKGVHLRRVKVKSLVNKRKMRENTIPPNLSSKHEVCFMMKSAFWTRACGTLTAAV